MEKHGMGTLLSVIFLILGTTFLPEPVDAAPQDYQNRNERSASPNPRCPNCPKDCPENLAGGLPESESEAERYNPMAEPPYSPPYNSVQQHYAVQPPSPYAVPAPPRPPPPAYGVAPPHAAYGAPPPAYAAQPPPAYPPPPVRPPYGVPPPSYGHPPPPARPVYGAPLPPPPPPAYAAPPPPPPPPASYNPPPPAPPASYNPPQPASYNLQPPASYSQPAPQPSYNQPPPPASYNQPEPPASYDPPSRSPPPTSYNQPEPPASYDPPSRSPPPTSYDQPEPSASYNPPSRPPPTETKEPTKIILNRPSSQPSSKSDYPKQLPPPPAIPNEPPLSDKSCYKQSPPPSPNPKIYDPLPPPRYNRLGNPWTPVVPPPQFRGFGYDPYAANPYQPNYLNARPAYSCNCDGYDLDDEDDVVFSKYNRRSSDNRYYRHSGHLVDPLNSPTSMYKNYRPYDRDEGRSVFSGDFGSEESIGSSKDQPRERLYVVYRADAMKDKRPSSSAPLSSYLTEDHSMTDREIESMIRRAIDVSRLQRSHQDNVLYSRADPRYQYQYVSQQLDAAEQPEFKSLSQQQYESQYPMDQYQLSPVQMMDQSQYVVRDEGDEANNPGWDQTKWTAVPAMSGDFDNPENVYAANVGVSNGASVVPIEAEPAAAAVVTPVEVVEEVEQIPEEVLPESRLEKKEAGELEAKEEKTEVVDLIEDMETPQTVTEPTSFDRHTETTTDDGMAQL